jgi:hypothetical protein
MHPAARILATTSRESARPWYFFRIFESGAVRRPLLSKTKPGKSEKVPKHAANFRSCTGRSCVSSRRAPALQARLGAACSEMALSRLIEDICLKALLVRPVYFAVSFATQRHLFHWKSPLLHQVD